MTGTEMVYSFQQLLLTISDSFVAKERLATYEILDYLNRTVDRYITTKYFKEQSFKANTAVLSASIDELDKLVVMTPITPVETFSAAPGMTGAYLSSLPSDFMGYIRSDTLISRTNVLPTTSQWVPNLEIDFNDINQILTTPFNKPILEQPNVTVLGEAGTYKDNFLTITDIHTGIPENNMITYVKEPTEIDMTGNHCELSITLHEEIVRLAVDMYVNEYKMRFANLKNPK